MAHSHHEHREHKVSRARAKHILGHKHGGGAHHADAAADRKMINASVHKHEAKMHGHKSGGRLDKYARGGPTKGKHHTQVNIAVVAPHKGSPPGAGAPPGGMASPPMPPPGGPPMGGPPMPPPGPGGGMPPMKRGGRTYKRGGGIGMTAGADSGPGRLQKAHKAAKH
jgi:hypothetical protein